MSYWLVKSEPDEFSIEDLKNKNITPWDGIRNYQARNFLREMQPGDQAFFYHSSCKEIGIAGTLKVVSTHYDDPIAVNPNSPYFDKKALDKNPWSTIDVEFHQMFSKILSLSAIKKLATTDLRLTDLALIKKGNRLSVMPVTTDQWQCIMENIAP